MSFTNELNDQISETINGLERFMSGKIGDGQVLLDYMEFEMSQIRRIHLELMGKIHGLHGIVASLEDRN